MDSFEAQLGNSIVLLVTFGAVFPPLGVLICLSVWSETYFKQLLVGRLLEQAERHNLLRTYQERLQRDLGGRLLHNLFNSSSSSSSSDGSKNLGQESISAASVEISAIYADQTPAPSVSLPLPTMVMSPLFPSQSHSQSLNLSLSLSDHLIHPREESSR